jgi:hypothetical protein
MFLVSPSPRLLVNAFEEEIGLSIGQRIVIALLVAAALALSACGPEDGRARGGGAGADVGNKPATVQPKSKVFTSQQP